MASTVTKVTLFKCSHLYQGMQPMLSHVMLSIMPGKQRQWWRCPRSQCGHARPGIVPRPHTGPCAGPHERATGQQREQSRRHEAQQFKLARQHHSPNGPSPTTTSSSSKCCCSCCHIPRHSLTLLVSNGILSEVLIQNC